MKKKLSIKFIAIVFSSSILLSSCIGSFSLFHKVLNWNQSLGDKFVNELVFIALTIVPVYPVATFIDVVVLNSIEFWTGENPVEANNSVKQVKGENDVNYTIITNEDGYTVAKEGSDEVVEFKFNKENKVWSIEANGQEAPFMQMLNDQEVIMYTSTGEMKVPLNAAGVLAFNQTALSTYFANK